MNSPEPKDCILCGIKMIDDSQKQYRYYKKDGTKYFDLRCYNCYWSIRRMPPKQGPEPAPPPAIEGKIWIPLMHGKFALIDEEDFEKVSQYNFWATYGGNKKQIWYAEGHVARTDKPIQMHRLIMNAPEGMFVDHRDHNGLNNTKENLRICTPQENNFNRNKEASNRKVTSKYKGVHWDKESKRWRAGVRFNGKQNDLGRFKNEEDAAKAYDKKALELFGEFARLNFPEDHPNLSQPQPQSP